MPTPTLDARPRGVHLRFRPGRTIAVRLAFPAGFVDGHTFTSTLGDEDLTVDVDGDDLLVTADETTTTTVGLVTATWLLVMDGEAVLGGLWSGSRSFADSGDVDATVVVEDLTVAVELVGPPGPQGEPGEGGPGGGAVDSVNDQTGVVVLTAADVGADPTGTAAAAVEAHRVDTTNVHGIADTSALVLTDDSRLTNSRTPTAHAASHQDGGSDELALDGSQITTGTVADARIASTIARDTEVTSAVAAEATLARNADNLTSGTVADARIASTIARDSEVAAAYQALTGKGAVGGYAELDGTGKVPSAQLPSFVDDVVEAANFAALPATGEAGKIYVTLDTNLTYRWSGSAYAEISASLALGETSTTAYRGDRGKTAYDHSQTTSGNPHNVTKSDVGLGNVDNTSDTNKPVSTAQQIALNLKANAANPVFTGTVTIPDGALAIADTSGLQTALDAKEPTLNAAGVVAKFTGTPNGAKFLADDGTLKTPAGGSTTTVGVVKQTDETVSASTTLQDDDELLFAVAASESWAFEFELFVDGNAGADIKISITVPSGASVLAQVVGVQVTESVAFGTAAMRAIGNVTASGGTVSAGITSPSGSPAGYYPLTIRGSVRNGVTPGNLTLQWAQNSATASTTVKAGSTLRAIKDV